MNNFIEKNLFEDIKKKIKKKQIFSVNATFTGTDKSLGYRTGKDYNLKISYHNEYISIENKKREFCLYSSTGSLLRNWNIKEIE